MKAYKGLIEGVSSISLLAGESFASVIDDLESGAPRVGIHVQDFVDGGSESFVNGASPVPEPATMLLLGLGLVGLAGYGRKATA